MLATCSSATLQGIDAALVHVEVNANEFGDPKLYIVGLPDAAVNPNFATRGLGLPSANR